ncbi:MAG TPA: inorganic phosphate transporter, partial [Candidatus Atribacteria bacterium]|nr:inorganic phosphate transporter [Candidatus Atribacteria bacterium]
LTATVASFSAAITVTLMSYLGLPVSTSQAIVGAIIGIGIVNNNINFSALPKIFSAWVLTPIGAAIISFLLYLAIRIIIRKYVKNQILFNKFILVGFYLVGGYGAYALGANNVANVTGIYVTSGMLTPFMGALLGGLSIGFGAITYSKNVMMTVGKKLLPLDYYSAFIAILAEAVTVHIYAIIGIPVSTSQAIVGGVLGIGLATGTRTINKRTLRNILFGWLGTPTISGVISFGVYELVRVV